MVEGHLLILECQGQPATLNDIINSTISFERVNSAINRRRPTAITPANANLGYIDGNSGGRGSRGSRGGRGGRRGRRGGSNSTTKCYNYRKPGHREKDYRSKHIPGQAPEN